MVKDVISDPFEKVFLFKIVNIIYLLTTFDIINNKFEVQRFVFTLRETSVTSTAHITKRSTMAGGWRIYFSDTST